MSYAVTKLTNLANAPGLLNALVVFAAYSIQAKLRHTPPLTTAQAFTALAIVGMLTAPLGLLLVIIYSVFSATGCYYRVQNFLRDRGFADKRSFSKRKGNGDRRDSDLDNDPTDTSLKTESRSCNLSVSGVVLGTSAEARETNIPVHFEARKGTLTMIIGPVGSGKSTLLNAILGEHVLEKGVIKMDTPVIGYCSQSPWLQNCSVRDNIIGFGLFDENWYSSVVQICALEQDLAQMPLRDSTIVGSRGVVLSGGQKHRIVRLSTLPFSFSILIYQQALARALYSRCSILVLDDFLGSLDEKTKRIVVHQLFSKDGHAHLRQCTIILVTHTSMSLR